MHIVIICDAGYVDGGAPKVAISSARGLAEAGLPVTYVCATGPVTAELVHPNIHVHCLNIESVWKQSNPLAAAARGIWNRHAKAEVERVLAALPQNETLVHFHQWTKAFSPSVLAIPSQLGLPSIASMHDYFLSCPNGAYYHFPAGAPCNLAPMSAACLTAKCDSRSSSYKAVRIARQFVINKTLAQADAPLNILNVSAFAGHVTDRFIPGRHRRYTVRSPIALTRAEPVAVARNREFIFIGRMTAEKGVRQLAEAARMMGLPVTFVGSGPLLEEIRAHGGMIRCEGWVDAQGIDTIMKRARALVFPSTWYETGGLVVLEALARGVPVIVSRQTAAADFVLEGDNGYLIDPADPAALQMAMMKLLDDALVERLGRNAYDHYWANPQSTEAHVSELLQVYRTVLSEHRLRPAGSSPS